MTNDPAVSAITPDPSEWVFITRGFEARGPDADGEIDVCVNVDGREQYFFLNALAVEKLASVLDRLLSSDRAVHPEEENPRCAGCGGPHPFDTSLPSVVWNRVIRAQGLADYLCLSCIVEAFGFAKESFTATLWGKCFDGQPIAVTIDGTIAMDANLLSHENTELRARIRELEASDRAVHPEEDQDAK